MSKLLQELNSITEKQSLEEALMTFGKKAYPSGDQVLILAGGAGSGKGFVLDKLIGLEGKTIDVDQLKSLIMTSTKLSKKIKDETGYDVTSMDLRKPENVSTLHQIVDNYDIVDKKMKALTKSIIAAERKPNLIFDVTLKNITKLHNISKKMKLLGYKKENIHLVWIVNDINVAKMQNKKRARVVPEDILVDTHRGASMTMKNILDMGKDIKKYLDGDVYLAFNKIGADTELVQSKNKPDHESGTYKSAMQGKKVKGSFIQKANYVKIKEKGKPITTSKNITKDIINKIKSYVPSIEDWK